MYVNTEILYPNYVTPILRDLRGPEWRDLVDHVLSLPEDHAEVLAFVMMMMRLNGCMECETDSYRAMRGCAMCATQTLHRYKGSDKDLLKAYAKALADIEAKLEDADHKIRRVA
jgi:hypothetical protein